MAGNQLPLSIPPDSAARRLPARISPMQPTAIDAPFDDPAYLFEPWWPGVRGLVFVDGGRLRLQAEGLSDALACLPELATLPRHLEVDGVVLDGTLLILDADGRPDADLLRRRLAGRGRSGRPAFVASDLLFAGGTSLMRRPFLARRQRLEEVLRAGDRVIVGRAYEGDGLLMADALRELGVEALSARQLSARYRAGSAGAAWLRAPTAVGGAEVQRGRPQLALIQRLPLEGS